MGRAIVRNPKAFLMDEPPVESRCEARVQMRGEIARLQKRLGTTTVYVTHDQTEAMTLGDPRGGVARGRGSAGRYAGGTLRSAAQMCSSLDSSVRPR